MIAILVGLILIGGIKRIGSVTEKLVPFMAAMYIIMAIILVIINIKSVPGVFASIFEGAFNPKSVTGGIVGSLFLSMRKGVSRGIFSNEAGLGTGSIAHACSDVKHPVQQGLWGIFEVFIDTIVICTLTALVILCSGTEVAYGQAAGSRSHDQRLCCNLRQLDIDIHSGGFVLFRVLNHTRMGTLRFKMCRIPVWK